MRVNERARLGIVLGRTEDQHTVGLGIVTWGATWVRYCIHETCSVRAGAWRLGLWHAKIRFGRLVRRSDKMAISRL